MCLLLNQNIGGNGQKRVEQNFKEGEAVTLDETMSFHDKEVSND